MSPTEEIKFTCDDIIGVIVSPLFTWTVGPGNHPFTVNIQLEVIIHKKQNYMFQRNFINLLIINYLIQLHDVTSINMNEFVRLVCSNNFIHNIIYNLQSKR